MLGQHYSCPPRHLTEEALTDLNGMAHLTTKQTYRAQMITFKVS